MNMDLQNMCAQNVQLKLLQVSASIENAKPAVSNVDKDVQLAFASTRNKSGTAKSAEVANYVFIWFTNTGAVNVLLDGQLKAAGPRNSHKQQ